MKRVFLLIPFLLLCISLGAAQKDTLRVLAIANSFGVDAVNQNLFEIAASDGKCVIIGDMYIGGCSLEKHWNNAKNNAPAYTYYQIKEDGVLRSTKDCSLEKALADEKWDVVTFQQSSPLSGKPESYEPYLEKLFKYVKKRVPKTTKFYFQQTWAYSRNAVHPHFPDYGCDQNRMYNDIMGASKAACDKYGFGVIPSGTAVQNVRDSWDRDNITRDGYHMNKMGRYTIALAWYETLFGTDARTIKYVNPDVAADRAEVAKAAAHAAVQSPYARTDIGYSNPNEMREEKGVPQYQLPDALTMQDGTPVQTPQQWYEQRRPELFDLFATYEFGKVPGPVEGIHYEVLHEEKCFDGRAKMKEVAIYFTKHNKKGPYMTLLVVIPANAEGPVPMFLGPNFRGNHTVFSDSRVIIPDGGRLSSYGRYEMLPRGAMASRWPIDMIIGAGYGVATFFLGDLDPDYDDGFLNGVHPLFYAKGQHFPKPDEWGAIGAWSWGLSRALDYLETDPAIDSKKVAVIGHSRLGKTALWTAARDQRFAMCISNNSGCGGAAISRRCFGETLERIQRSFPHWFCGNFRQFSSNENALPFDQHELLALVAPRPLYVASASFDLHSDPNGEFVAALEASKVYEFLGCKGVCSDGSVPPVNTPMMEGDIAYHLRAGFHDINAFDWAQYIKFADKYFK